MISIVMIFCVGSCVFWDSDGTKMKIEVVGTLLDWGVGDSTMSVFLQTSSNL